jgi:hypothetical protein
MRPNIPITLFTDLPQYQQTQRVDLADLLRPLINSRSLEQNRAIYGCMVDQYALSDQLEQADWAVLLYHWNYYHQSHQLGTAQRFIQKAHEAGKPVLTWVGGDFGARVLDPEAWVFGAAGYQSRAGSRRFGTPVFIRDPLREHGFEHIQPLAKPPKPLIGFCGYARTTPFKAAAFTLTTLRRNLLSALHLTGDEPQAFCPPPVLLRQRLLERLSCSPLVETDFIQNTQYQAGARTAQSKAEAQARFFHNIRSTAYTLCVRGSGNFSVRLYETLAMGRIPILVDTDCLLPYASHPGWKTCCVYVPQAETARIAEIVAAFHDRLSADDFIALQYQARRFWEERLSLEGFFTHFPEHFYGAEGSI